jgi:two-component system LytT family response regulator
MTIRALIVDDEPLARERLQMMLKPEIDIEVVGEAINGDAAVGAIRKLDPDLVFLDIQMPVIDGFSVITEIGAEQMPLTIFVTAYDRYALRAFEVHALDYLLKPFDRERFQQALARARAQLQGKETAALNQRLAALLEQLHGEKQPLERVVVKESGRIFFLKAEEIDWVEAAENYVNIHAGKASHLLRETMSRLETRLDPTRFVRIHRSAIINIERLQELQPLFHGDYTVILNDGTKLTLSRGYKEKFQERLGKPL